MTNDKKKNRKVRKPGRHWRDGISLLELHRLFPDEDSARKWFENIVWPDGEKYCPRCGCNDTQKSTHKTMPYRCRPCRRFFSVRLGTVLESSKLSLQTWVYAIYLEMTSLKGLSSMKLHRDLGIRQDTAWFLQHRIRKAFFQEFGEFTGPVEVDETYVGGKEKNRRNSEKTFDRGVQGKAIVVGIKDRETNRITAQVVGDTTRETLQSFVMDHTASGATVYTDEHRSYGGLKEYYEHEAVKHGVSEYVKDQAHVNGMESFWAVFKRAYHGVFHQVSPKHLHRYVSQFAEKHNMREMDTMEQMEHVVAGMVGKRLMYKDLVA